MKITLFLFALALLGLVAALLLPRLRASRQPSQRFLRRHRVRPFNLLERLMLPAVMALSILAPRCRQYFGANRLTLANAIATMPECCDTALADEVIARYQLVKIGTDVYHKGLCDKGDIPAGFTREASAASGDRFAFDYFGLSRKATKATASGAITAGHLVCPGDDGTIRDVTLVTTETIYVCGLAISTAATTAECVFIPFAPTKLVIA